MVRWNELSRTGKIVMVVMAPIFALVAGVELLIAKLTGRTYNEINIIVYYMLIPVSWLVMVDYLTRLTFLTPMYIIGIVLFLWKDPMSFRNRCDWLFEKSVDFLLLAEHIGWNYIVSSVIICVVVPLLIYAELIYALVCQ